MRAFLAQARASQQQGTLVHRELHKQAYNDALVQRYQHLPDVKRIQRHRHLPTPLYKVPSSCQALGQPMFSASCTTSGPSSPELSSPKLMVPLQCCAYQSCTFSALLLLGMTKQEPAS